jgi:hypothetical protein
VKARCSSGHLANLSEHMLSKRFTKAAQSHQSEDTVKSKSLILGGVDFGPLQSRYPE